MHAQQRAASEVFNAAQIVCAGSSISTEVGPSAHEEQQYQELIARLGNMLTGTGGWGDPGAATGGDPERARSTSGSLGQGFELDMSPEHASPARVCHLSKPSAESAMCRLHLHRFLKEGCKALFGGVTLHQCPHKVAAAKSGCCCI
jgi:hypothetical protein